MNGQKNGVVNAVIMWVAVIMARVSTSWQAQQGTSLEAQVETCTRFVEGRGWAIHKVYREEGKSGARYMSRGELQDALAEIEAGRANVFVTYLLDRTGREVDVLRPIRKRVLAAGGRFFLSNGMEFPDTPEGDLMFTQLAAYAEFEKASIRTRTVAGRRSRAAEGKQPYRRFSPYGYHVVSHVDVVRGDFPSVLVGTYQILKGALDSNSGIFLRGASDWAREVFERYATGTSAGKLILWLFSNNVASPEGAARWSKTTLRRMLQNPVYKGQPVAERTRRVVDEERMLQGKDIEYKVARPEEEWIWLAPCEPTTSVEVWDACQERLRENKDRHGGNPKRRSQLGGMIRCPLCGRVVAFSGGYYDCPRGRGCGTWRIQATRIQALVEQVVLTVARTPELTATAIRAYKKDREEDYDGAALPRLDYQLAELDRKIGAVVRLQVAAAMDDRSDMIRLYDTQLDETNTKRNELADRRLVLLAERVEAPMDFKTTTGRIVSACDAVQEALSSPHLTPFEKNEILSTIIATIKPNEANTKVVVVLRSFFGGVKLQTGTQILMSATALIIPASPLDRDAKSLSKQTDS